MTRRTRTAVAVVVAYLAALTAATLMQLSTTGLDSELVEAVVYPAAFGLFAVLGAVLISRRPGHVMGPLFAAVGLLAAIAVPGDAYVASVVIAGSTPPWFVRLLAWPGAWYWYALIIIVVFYVPLLFPDGRLPSSLWRWLAWPVGATTVAACAISAVSERIVLQTLGPDGEALSVVNPLGLAGMPHGEDNPLFSVLTAPLLLGVFGALVAVVVRFRRSRGDERQQLKWFVSAVGLLITGTLLAETPLAVARTVGGAAALTGIVAVPVAITLAILRYRLYDIDRIVSRTVTYALVTAVLFVIYTAVVTLPGALFALESDLLVAAATLVAAGVFVPLRRRVQSIVDARFNRARYDAGIVVERFADRLRSDVDARRLAADLQTTVAATVQPLRVSLWLRDAGDTR